MMRTVPHMTRNSKQPLTARSRQSRRNCAKPHIAREQSVDFRAPSQLRSTRGRLGVAI